jgi:hypothetical protein
MRADLTKILYDKYPQLFPRKCEISCGDGWFDILNKLCYDIASFVEIDPTAEFRCQQIKEKFGGLRFYGSGGDMKIYELIDTVQRSSMYICETCGAAGIRRGESWLYTSCEEHKRD